MKVILVDPDSEEAKVRKRAEKRNASAHFLKVSLERLEELADMYGKLEIRLTRSPVYCSLFFGDESVFYDPYHLGRFPQQLSGQNQFIWIEFARGHCYDLLKAHFEFLWHDESTFNMRELVTRYRREMKG